MTVPDDFTGGFTNPPPPPYGAPSQGGWNQQSGFNQPQYGGPMYSGNPQNGLGIAACVLGILSILLGLLLIGGVLGVVAIGLGFAGRGRVRQGLATNKGAATAGIVTGSIGFLLSVFVVVVLVAGSIAFWHSKTVKDIRQCLSNDKAQQTACEQKLGITPTPTTTGS